MSAPLYRSTAGDNRPTPSPCPKAVRPGGSGVSAYGSSRFDLIFPDVLIPFLIREFTYPQLLKPINLRARGFVRSKGADFMSQLFTRFWKDQSAATAIEYGLIAAGISVAIIAAVNGIGTKLNTSFGSISTQLK
jgi:pilus assembly protein Flp/PilA